MQRIVTLAICTVACVSLPIPPAGAASEAQFTFGGSKQSALSTLRHIGIRVLALDIHPAVQVTSPRDFEHIQHAEGVVVGAGDLRAGFRDDSVEYFKIAPIHDRWQQYFNTADSRASILAGLKRLFLAEPGVQIRSVAVRNTQVGINELSAQDQRLLEHYNQWSGSYTDSKGYWHLTLSFEQGRLSEVTRRWLAEPL